MGPTTPQPTEIVDEGSSSVVVDNSTDNPENSRITQPPVEPYISIGAGYCWGGEPDVDNPEENQYIGMEQDDTDTEQDCAYSCQECYCGVLQDLRVLYVGFQISNPTSGSKVGCSCLFSNKKVEIDPKYPDKFEESDDLLIWSDLYQMKENCIQARGVLLPDGTVVDPPDNNSTVQDESQGPPFAAEGPIVDREGFGNAFLCYSVRSNRGGYSAKKPCSLLGSNHFHFHLVSFNNSTLSSNFYCFPPFDLVTLTDWKQNR